MKFWPVAVVGALIGACASDPSAREVPVKSGSFRLVTYNVAGLPQGLSSSNPTANMPQISPRLNAFDLVLVQEDFAFHDALIGSLDFAFKTTRIGTGLITDLGDGLNAFARTPILQVSRDAWGVCNGVFDQANDCLAKKGFSRFVLDFGGGASLDVYNVHFDAGQSAADVVAREAQVIQIADAIEARSKDRAVVVAVDTNMGSRDVATFEALLARASLRDACRELACTEPHRIDRVMVRDAPGMKLSVSDYLVDQTFVDAAGTQLSDHKPVVVTVSFQRD